MPSQQSKGFFDRTLALHTERLGVSYRVQANALSRREPRTVSALAISCSSRGVADVRVVSTQE
jgi:hypothetical protein